MTDPSRGDDWDTAALWLDEDFVRRGPHEPSAAERLGSGGVEAPPEAPAPPAALAPPAVPAPPALGRRATLLLLLPRSRRKRRALLGGLTLAAAAALLLVGVALAQLEGALSGRRLAPAPPAPAGSGGSAFLAVAPDATGRPVAFDPCRPVRYVVNGEGAPPGASERLALAVADLSAATGLVFFDEGPTRERPRPAGWSPADDGSAPPVLVAWSSPDETAALRTSPVQAGPVAGPDGDRWVSGQVVLDGEALDHAPGDPAGEAAVTAALLHGLGHLVGLDHVDTPGQVMTAPVAATGDPAGPPVLEWGEGDLRGLHAVGTGPCARGLG